METANLIFHMVHPERVRDLTAATEIARRIVDYVSTAAPAEGWRADEHAVPIPTSQIAELVIPNLTTIDDTAAGYSWGITSGSPPLDLYLSMTIGVDGVESSGKARLRFEELDQFARLEAAYEMMSTDPALDRLHLSVGVDFHLRMSRLDPERQPRPVLGWRNRVKRPASDGGLQLPDWVTVTLDPTHADVQLGPSPYDLDVRDAAKVLDDLVTAGYL